MYEGGSGTWRIPKEPKTERTARPLSACACERHHISCKRGGGNIALFPSLFLSLSLSLFLFLSLFLSPFTRCMRLHKTPHVMLRF